MAVRKFQLLEGTTHDVSCSRWRLYDKCKYSKRKHNKISSQMTLKKSDGLRCFIFFLFVMKSE